MRSDSHHAANALYTSRLVNLATATRSLRLSLAVSSRTSIHRENAARSVRRNAARTRRSQRVIFASHARVAAASRRRASSAVVVASSQS